MIRRFNLRFSLVSKDMLEDGDDDIFATGQLFLCPLSLATHDAIAPQIRASDWDMLVVD